jgi:hypothetical protein
LYVYVWVHKCSGKHKKALSVHLWLTLRVCTSRKGRSDRVLIVSLSTYTQSPFQRLGDILIPGN